MDLLTEIESLKADASAAQGLLEEAKLSADAQAALIAERDLAIDGLNAGLAAKSDEVASLLSAIGEKDKAIAGLEAALAAMEAKEKSAAEKAVEIVANLGIKPMKADHSAEAAVMDKAQVVAELQAIKDPVERANFYFANKAILFGK